MGPAIMDGFVAFEEVCRGRLERKISKQDLGSFVTRISDPLPAEDAELFMRFLGIRDAPSNAQVDYTAVLSALLTAARAAKA